MTAPALAPVELPELTLNCEVRLSGCTGRATHWGGAHPGEVTCGERVFCWSCHLKLVKEFEWFNVRRAGVRCQFCSRVFFTYLDAIRVETL